MIDREKNDLEKWRKLYAGGDPTWTYWDKKYYDLVVNTYNKSSEETFQNTLGALGIE